MTSGPERQAPKLALVTGDTGPVGVDRAPLDKGVDIARDVDWSILMARAQDGDGAAYRRLLEDLAPYLRSLAARRHRDPSDIEDAVQDILLTVHAIRQTYDPARPFGPWLLAIAKRRLVDRLRRQGRRKLQEAALAAEHDIHGGDVSGPDDTADHHNLDAAIERLPPGQKQAIRLLKLKEMPLNEAAAASGMSVASLKVATHRAIARLREMMTEWSDR
jgi:RNA polymerase sigma-70 factor (ECF subfamily)